MIESRMPSVNGKSEDDATSAAAARNTVDKRNFSILIVLEVLLRVQVGIATAFSSVWCQMKKLSGKGMKTIFIVSGLIRLR